MFAHIAVLTSTQFSGQTVLFLTIQFCMIKKVKRFQVLLCVTDNLIKHQSFIYTQSNDPTFLFQAVQFSISHLFVLSLNVKQFYLTHRTLSSAITPGQSRPRSNGIERVLHIPQSSRTGASPSDWLVSYLGHILEVPFSREAVGVFYTPIWPGWFFRVRLFSLC